jgi:hypothetical protein
MADSARLRAERVWPWKASRIGRSTRSNSGVGMRYLCGVHRLHGVLPSCVERSGRGRDPEIAPGPVAGADAALSDRASIHGVSSNIVTPPSDNLPYCRKLRASSNQINRA